jgi:hypothetical protein
MTANGRKGFFQHPAKKKSRAISRQAKELRENSFTEGGALGSKTGDNGQMADEKSRGHDCLPQSTRATGDFQKLLLQTLHDEPEGKSERPFKRRFFPIHLHEGTYRLPGVSHREEAVSRPTLYPAPAGGQTLVHPFPGCSTRTLNP